MSRRWLAPLTPLYGSAVAVKNFAYDRSWLKPNRLRSPVISIGNLSVGGSGKTPLTIRLAELLTAEGFQVDVLSRGYGRSEKTTERVDPAGGADQFGDEPLLIARRTGVPVFVGADRFQAGQLAEQEIERSAGAPPLPLVHLLDDGFQHRRLAREVDIVVMHRSDSAERLLPAGRLREPLRALRRASFVVLRDEDAELAGEVRKLGVQAPIWLMRRIASLIDDDPPSSSAATPRRAIAFCGIARPAEFFSGLSGLGVHLEQSVAFADHHRYIREDVERLARSARGIQADLFVATEKDAVKLDVALREVLEAAAPLGIVRLSVSLQDEIAVVRQLIEKLVSGP